LAIVLLHLFTNLLPILPVRLLAPPLAKQFNSVYLKAKGKKEWLLSVQYLSTSVAVLRRMAFEHPFGADHTNQCMWRQMIYELTYGTRGPMDAIVEYINTHAEPGDLLWTGYGDLPLIFHTDTKVISWYMTALEPGSYRNADWILPRAFTPFYLMLHGKLRVAGAGKYTREFPPHLAANYEQVSLRIKDAPCNNRPDPDSHTFRTSFGQPFVHIFHRKTLKKP
jgi:hypothetical protein